MHAKAHPDVLAAKVALGNQMKHSLASLALGASLTALATPALANYCSPSSGLIVCSGVGMQSAFGTASEARAEFLGSTVESKTQTFESFSSSTPTVIDADLSLAFDALASTLSPTPVFNPTGEGGQVAISQNFGSTASLGRFNTTASGEMVLESSGSFQIKFASTIKAFGFYGTDIGDFGGILSIQLCNSGSNDCSDALRASGDPLPADPNGVDPASTDASLLFWGFIDESGRYDTVRFLHTNGGDNFSPDGFGYDDMVVATTLRPNGGGGGDVPEPATLALLGLGLLGLTRVRKGTH